MPSHKSTAVFGYTIAEVTEALRSTPFLRDSSKKQYKTVNGKRFPVFCGCNLKPKGLDITHNTPNYWNYSCFQIAYWCPKCGCGSYVDLTSLNLPKE